MNFMDINNAACLHSELGFGAIRRDLEALQQFTTVPREAIRIALRRDMIAEELRVLYVARTRGKEQLIFTAALPNPAKKIGTLAGQLAGLSVLPPYLMETAGSYFDWLIWGFLRHPNAEFLRKLGPGVSPLPAEGEMLLLLCLCFRGRCSSYAGFRRTRLS